MAHCGLLSSLVGPYFTGEGMFYKANLVISLFFLASMPYREKKMKRYMMNAPAMQKQASYVIRLCQCILAK